MIMSTGTRYWIGLALLLTTAACAGRTTMAPLAPLPFATDTVRSQSIGEGVSLHYVYSPVGPWAIHVLDVRLDRCNSAIAVKGADSAAARIKTSVMMSAVAPRGVVLGGVNADFFSLANGTPIGMLIVDGRMLTPPTAAPVLAFDSAGTPRVATFMREGGTLRPFAPREAVGGRPVLVRDGSVLAGLDTVGGATFGAARHPRTAAGIAQNGKRLFLAVVDGRQKPYSDGMSLAELANFMLALGARNAINLDGGGSTTLVYADPATPGSLRIANRPSDKEGERAVGDALAIVNRCGVGSSH